MNTTFYQRTLGALFDYHPDLQPAVRRSLPLCPFAFWPPLALTLNLQIFTVLDANHPSTSMLPARWNVTEEVYNFLTDPRDVGAKVLLSVDETSYVGEWVRHSGVKVMADG